MVQSASSALTRSIGRRSATSIRLAAPLPLEVPDVVRGLGDDVACQLENLWNIQINGEEVH
jgi:hypothetical protein